MRYSERVQKKINELRDRSCGHVLTAEEQRSASLSAIAAVFREDASRTHCDECGGRITQRIMATERGMGGVRYMLSTPECSLCSKSFVATNAAKIMNVSEMRESLVKLDATRFY